LSGGGVWRRRRRPARSGRRPRERGRPSQQSARARAGFFMARARGVCVSRRAHE
jgi:hypothetical protein